MIRQLLMNDVHGCTNAAGAWMRRSGHVVLKGVLTRFRAHKPALLQELIDLVDGIKPLTKYKSWFILTLLDWEYSVGNWPRRIRRGFLLSGASISLISETPLSPNRQRYL
jgi:hypothetical protein